MVELVVLACLIAKPSYCQGFNIPFQATNMNQCVWQAQIHAAEWSAGHPGWLIRKFTCRLPSA
ncbi:hypothetical protein SAMN07250955_1152 [Arboricoccus pini]|uniref:Uncharacterized protein n=1 Tax=Arboricoccus pini TaxID=1963835 RepID=A0A212RUD7_9PROT|nr:hypothetical protein SAMN07250955_1152 [Arboricoccus pini]